MRGLYTALVTPFTSDGSLDLEALRRLIAHQAEGGVDGIVLFGTTGEAPTLTDEDRKSILSEAKKGLKGTSLKLILGTGSNDTHKTVELSKWAEDQGAGALLVVTPYYNKPSQAGLTAHFTAVADATSCEIILYNVPGRTGISLTPATIAKLAAHPRIRTIKEATGNVGFGSEVIDALKQAKQSMDVLSGDDATAWPLMAVGAVGIISVASHVVAQPMAAMVAAALQGDYTKGQALHQKCFPVFKDLFVESNPVPVKYALHRMGLCGPTVRPPLAPLTSESVRVVEQALARVSG